MCKESGFSRFYAYVWENELASKEARLHALRINHGIKVYCTLMPRLKLPVVSNGATWTDESLGLPQIEPEFQTCLIEPALWSLRGTREFRNFFNVMGVLE